MESKGFPKFEGHDSGNPPLDENPHSEVVVKERQGLKNSHHNLLGYPPLYLSSPVGLLSPSPPNLSGSV